MDFLQSLVCGIHADPSFCLLKVLGLNKDSQVYFMNKPLPRQMDVRNLPFLIRPFLTFSLPLSAFVLNLPKSIPFSLYALSLHSSTGPEWFWERWAQTAVFLTSPHSWLLIACPSPALFSWFQKSCSNNPTLDLVRECQNCPFYEEIKRLLRNSFIFLVVSIFVFILFRDTCYQLCTFSLPYE